MRIPWTFRGIGLVAILAVGLMLVSSVSASVPPGSWVMVTPFQVGLGNPIEVEIGGPQNQSFHLALYSQPFNTTTAVFNYTFKTPISNRTSETFTNVTIPTNVLELGRYQVKLFSAQGVELQAAYTQVTWPFNVTAIQENVTAIAEEEYALGEEIAGQGAEITALTNQVQGLVWVFAGGVLWFTLYGPVSGYLRKRRGFLKSTRDKWHDFWYRWGPNRFAVGASTDLPVDYDTRRVWISGYCRITRESWATEAEMIHHLQTHDGIPNPRRDYDYYQDPEAVERVAEFARREPPTGRSAKALDDSYKIPGFGGQP